MNDDLRRRVASLFPSLKEALTDLVRIPSVSAAAYDPGRVQASAQRVAELLAAAGCSQVRVLEVEGAHPAVFAEVPGPPGSPQVLLYAHHDVQPPGPAEEWTTGPFDPFERNGRLYGRGASDDKSGVVMHLGAIRAFDGKPPVGLKIFIEGEEEIGSGHLAQFLETYAGLLSADVIVIADLGVWRVGQPALTTSLRGVTACVVEVRTLENAVHSGEFGGTFPDALTVLCRLVASLHDDQGNVAVPGLVSSTADPLDLTEEELRAQMRTVPGLEPIGNGDWTTRLWAKPSISVLAMDAPPIREAINQLVPVARAKVGIRLAPGQDGEFAMQAVQRHLETNLPWGARMTVHWDGYGAPFSLDSKGPAFTAYRQAMREAWGVEPVDIGAGGSIPFVATFAERMPDAPILMVGAGDPTSSVHAPNESQHLGDLERSILAEAIFLRLLSQTGG
jgi:acetylornithine deacetylase/succinyl-diaminopimelate desuccinylase-like protein